MIIKDNLLYTNDHEWVKVEEDIAIIGITDFAQHQMGDVVYVELPDLELEVSQNEAMCSIESVKAASDILAPLTGIITEVNDQLEDSPQLLNEAPYEQWIAKIKLSDVDELNNLLNSKDYNKLCSEEA